MRLRFQEQKWTRGAPTPGLRGSGTSPGSPAGFLGSSGWGKCPPLLSCSSCLGIGRAPTGGSLLPASPDLPGLTPVPPGPTKPGWGFGGGGYRPVSSTGSPGRVGQAIALHSSPTPPRGPLPDLPGLRGTNPVWPPLLLPPLSSHVLPVHLGFPPISLGIRVPHQWLAGALVVGRKVQFSNTEPGRIRKYKQTNHK